MKMSVPNFRKREVLQLYRDILRACRRFHWQDHNGELWGHVLARNARHEFEQARYENDPEVIAQLLVGGRQALIKIEEKVTGAEYGMFEKFASTRTDTDPEATQRTTDRAEKYRRQGIPEEWETIESTPTKGTDQSGRE
eukprot:gb/GECG01015727.1/.p1 GENE.gb/GECG01015727.1/~~gb/GECG01015727.1/.p1  ORF type:complete len:139 (+),score=18.34 gb/GECG01015727.1/:1-417(+)